MTSNFALYRRLKKGSLFELETAIKSKVQATSDWSKQTIDRPNILVVGLVDVVEGLELAVEAVLDEEEVVVAAKSKAAQVRAQQRAQVDVDGET